MKYYVTLFILVLTILLALCISSPVQASANLAQMRRYVPQGEPNVTVLNFRGRVVFSQQFVICHAQINCLTIHNGLSPYIYLYLNSRYYDPMWGGETISPTLTWGRNVFTLPWINRATVLTVMVLQPPRYNRTARPMYRGWRRF